MEWVDKLNEGVNYIENHLTEKIDYEQLEKIVCCSAYQFQYMFTYISGISLTEYIRRRKMSLAVIDLQHKNMKIIDVAVKYGYTSPTAFNRAFRSVHGIAPSKLKNEGVSIRLYPPILFQITVKGAKKMDYRIETKEAFRVVGIAMDVKKEKDITAKWTEIASTGVLEKLMQLMNRQPMGMLGIGQWDNEDLKSYYIAVSSSKEAQDLVEYEVPAATWAIFSGTGAYPSIKTLVGRIMTEWFPNSGYEHAKNVPDVEVYLNSDPRNARYEMWIPVVKKA